MGGGLRHACYPQARRTERVVSGTATGERPRNPLHSILRMFGSINVANNPPCCADTNVSEPIRFFSPNLALVAIVLYCGGGLVNADVAAIDFAPNLVAESRSAESNDGPSPLKWVPPSESYQVEVPQSSSRSFADAVSRYAGVEAGSVQTRPPEGEQFFRIHAGDATGQPGPWSEPLEVQVACMDRGQLWLLLSLGRNGDGPHGRRNSWRTPAHSQHRVIILAASISPSLGWVIVLILGGLWIALGILWGRKTKTFDGFVAAGRNVGMAFSSATAMATWVTSPVFALTPGVWGMLAMRFWRRLGFRPDANSRNLFKTISGHLHTG